MSGARATVTHDAELLSHHEEQLTREIDTLRDVAAKSQDPLLVAIVDPMVLPSEPGAGRPFVTMGELDPGSLTPGDHPAMNLLVDREREFFTELGLGHLLTRGSGDTATSVGVWSITYSPVGPGGRNVEDDTFPEGAYEEL